MTTDEEENLYDAARQIGDAAARAAFLEEACAGNTAVRARIESLLGAGAEADDFFRRKSVDLEELPPLSGETGDVIGRYRLVRQIGEGGFGTVWLAEQYEPVTRQVALKIIKAGMDTREVIARFEQERQALAMMDHPNIAKVLDAGTTDAGRPFFVMELVPGVPITAYCHEAQLGTRECLALFGDVCAAIQHAHQKGIIHRDVKPSNVLVAMHDGRPVVKVIDFGIAKATQGKLTDKTLATRMEQFVGTPVYMSPEQATASGLDLDSRSDIYGLGILLYELLTGRPPFDAQSLASAGYEEMRRIIREVDPPRPSVRWRETTMGGARKALRRRGLARPSGPSLPFPADLDWIVMKAIEKDRTRRYDSASGLAEDIQRFLAHEPVRARPPGAGYRFQKWVRRNRVAFAAGAAVAAALIIGLSLATWMFFKERTARREADAATRRLERQVYAADMNLAKTAWDQAHAGRVLTLLRAHLPEAGAEDLRGFEWYYLERLCRSEVVTLKSPNALTSAAISPDGKYIAAGGHSQTLLLWNAVTGEKIINEEGTAGAVHDVAFNHDGTLLAAAFGQSKRPGEVIVREVAGGRVVTSFKQITGNATGVSFSADGKRLAFSSDEGAEVRDLASGALVFPLPHGGAVYDVTFGANGSRLATAGADKTVQVWDAANGTLLLTLTGHRHIVASVAFSPDGATLASGSYDQTAKLWNAATGEELRTLKGHDYHVMGVAFSPDGTQLATASDDRTWKLWEAATGTEISTVQGHLSAVRAVTFNSDGRQVISTGDDGAVKVWNATGEQESRTMQGGPWRGYGLVFHPDGNEIASAHWDGSLKTWSPTTGEIVFNFPARTPGDKGDNGWVEAIAYSPDGKRIVSGCDDAPLKVRDAVTGQELVTLSGHNTKVRCAAWSADGKFVAAGAEVATRGDNVATKAANHFPLRIWDAASGTELFALKGHTNNVLGVAFRPDGQQLASAGNDGTVRVWETNTGRQLLVLNGHPTGVRSIAWSPDGTLLASGGYDETVRLWDAASGRELHKLTGHTGGVFAVAFSPDGKRVASGGTDDRALKFWDVTSGQETMTLKAHDDRITAVSFSPDGRQVATAGWDKQVKVWDAREPQRRGQMPVVSAAEFWKEYDASKAATGAK